MKKVVAIISLLAGSFLMMNSANAITDGGLDGEAHPNVGILLFWDATSAWRCSGTLMSETLVLTAGHCTDGALGGRIWFESTETDLIDVGGYPGGAPFGSGFIGTAVEFSGIHTHPDFGTASFVFNDIGVVELAAPVFSSTYGALPAVGELNALKTKRGKQNQTFTAVGYGLQQINPVFVEAERTRMVAMPHLIQINVPGFTGDFSLLLSNNHSTGGTCFGDSGGPNFIGDSNVIGGVTSFGINGNCAGTGGVYRLDQAKDRAWLDSFFTE